MPRFLCQPDHAALMARDGLGWEPDGAGGLWLERPMPRRSLWRAIIRRLRMARLEHVNLTVADPDATAAMLGDIFGWTVRWQGTAIHGGRTVHVGTGTEYLAVYTGPGGVPQKPACDSYTQRAGLNHIGVVVDDLDAVEAKVTARGYAPHSHADYAPGRRFYFREENGVEIEVVSYA